MGGDEADTRLSELRREKAAVREHMRAVRASIAPDERLRLAEAIEARAFSLPALTGANTIMLFASFGSEVPTGAMGDRLRAEGRRTLYPFLSSGEMRVGEVHRADEMVKSAYGPLEPAARLSISAAEIDVVLVPGLAFDRAGFRLGYGGGHFDRFLVHLPASAVRVGLAFHVQVIDPVPRGPGDRAVEIIVTDQETILCRR